MGRPPKNGDHVLVRLRKELSTPDRKFTRAMLAARIGVSASGIRDIECEKFQLTEAVAQRIMLATGVSVHSLFNQDDPLKDIAGEPFDRDISPLVGGKHISYQEGFAMDAMLEIAIRTADKMKKGKMFYQLFKEWLPKALDTIGATSAMKTTLNRNLGIFDPAEVPDALQPTDPRIKQLWEETSKELSRMRFEEFKRLDATFKEQGDPHPFLNAMQTAYENVLNGEQLRDRMRKRPAH